MLYSLQKEHLEKCKFSAESKQLFSEDKFRKEENRIKFCRLRDFSSNDQFDEKFKILKPFLYARDLAVSEKPTFRKWFITEKVDSFPHGFLSYSMHKNLEKYTFFFFKVKEHDACVCLISVGRISSFQKIKSNSFGQDNWGS